MKISLGQPHRSIARFIHCCRNPRDTCLSIFKNDFSEDGNYYAYDRGELGRYHNLYRDLLANCGLEWDDAGLEFHRTDRPVQNASAAQVRRPIYKDSVRSWKRYERQLTPLFDVLGR